MITSATSVHGAVGLFALEGHFRLKVQDDGGGSHPSLYVLAR